ncbi:MAG: calcium/sodium antiporter [Candidatus Aegiribacteria sp.]|nr:calcium/sodium antiporter [Candidatus Aegiribacteria sp.]
MIQHYLFLIAGFVLLVTGGNYLIKGGSRLSALFGVSPLLIGLGIAALGTSAPEAAVSIKAALSDHSSVSIGNILGSNIANIGLAIALSLLIFGMQHRQRRIWKEIVFSFLATLLLLFLCTEPLSTVKTFGLTRSGGFILLFFFFGYLFYLFRMGRSDRKKRLNKTKNSCKNLPLEYARSIAMTAGGIGGVILGGDFVVDSAVLIAESWGVTETLISVTVVALGTSLPEIIVSVIAVRKNHWDMALGNIVGSNLFNILFVLGATAAIRPMDFPEFNQMVLPDILVVLGITVMLLMFMIFKGKAGSPGRTRRIEGGIMLMAYILYIAFVIVRR